MGGLSARVGGGSGGATGDGPASLTEGGTSLGGLLSREWRLSPGGFSGEG